MSSQNFKMANDKKWNCLMMLICQQHDVNNYRETISDSFNYYPPCRPALLDVFRDVILDKYFPTYFSSRSKVLTEFEMTIEKFFKEINSLLDLEYNNPDYVAVDNSSENYNMSGSGFVCSICHWSLSVLSSLCIKYGHNLGLSDTSLADKINKWKEIKVINDIIDLFAKTVDSKLSNRETTAFLLRSVSQHKSNISWVLKYVGERIIDDRIVSKIVDIILQEGNDLSSNCCLLQASNLTLNYLGINHLKMMQNLIKIKLEDVLLQSTKHSYNFNTNKPNYVCLIQFVFILASSMENNELLSSIFNLISSILRQFTPKTIEMFLIQQNCSFQTMKSFQHSIINLCINAAIPEIIPILDYMEIYANLPYPTQECSPIFIRACNIICRTICIMLFNKSHSINTLITNYNNHHHNAMHQANSSYSNIPIGLAAMITNSSELWIKKAVNNGSLISIQFLVGSIMVQSLELGEDLLIAIIKGPQLKNGIFAQRTPGHIRALGFFPMILNELEIADTNILNRVIIQIFSDAMMLNITQKIQILANIIYLVRRENVLNSQRRRITRVLNGQLDQLLLLVYSTLSTNRININHFQQPIISLISHSVCLLVQLDALSDEKYSIPINSHPFIPVPIKNDIRYKSLPIFVSARIVQCCVGILSVLLHLYMTDNSNNKIWCFTRIYVQLLINFVKTVFRGHYSAALQIVLREYFKFYKIETNSKALFKKRIRPDWFITPLLHDYKPENLNTGQIVIRRRHSETFHGVKEATKNRTSLLMVQQYWDYIISSIIQLSEPYLDNVPKPAYILHWIMRECLVPDYYLYINPNTDASPRNVNSIVMVWKRFKSNTLLWNLLSYISELDPQTLKPPFQTCEILMSACRYLWSTADCPRIKPRNNGSISQTNNNNATSYYEPSFSDLFYSDSEVSDALLVKRRPIELADPDSELFHLTVKLLNILSTQIPLVGELALLLGYMSPVEIQAILTHLLLNWQLITQPPKAPIINNNININNFNINGNTNNANPKSEDCSKMEVDEIVKTTDEDKALTKPIESPVPMDVCNENINGTELLNNDSSAVAMPPVPVVPLSWDTVLSSIIHTRVHCKGLYDQFDRLLFMVHD